MLLKHIATWSKYLNGDIGIDSTLINRNPKFRRGVILLIGMVDSPHFRKWLSSTQSNLPDAKIWVFASDRPHLDRSAIKILKNQHNHTKIVRIFPHKKVNFAIYYVFDIIFKMPWRAWLLRKVIVAVRPEIVHIHEFQHGAYIYNHIFRFKKTHSAKKYIISSWGSDLSLFSWVDGNENPLRMALS